MAERFWRNGRRRRRRTIERAGRELVRERRGGARWSNGEAGAGFVSDGYDNKNDNGGCDSGPGDGSRPE